MLIRRNPRLEEELKREPEFQQGLSESAEVLKDAVVDATPEGTGAARRNVRVVEVDGEVLVATFDIAGHLIEFGSVNNEAYAPLRRGARNAGFRLQEK